MGKEKLLILDLDDTIFETRSIPRKHLRGVLEEFKAAFSNHFDSQKFEKVEPDLWRLPFDHVAKKHHFPTLLARQYTTIIDRQEFNFEISPFPDYKWIRESSFRKILVTTGIRKLQMAKVVALGIEADFDAIHYDEVDATKRIFKSGIFSQIVTESGLPSKDHLVIGDNPESELKAGHELGLTTVQVAKYGQEASQYADHYITDFQQLFQKKL